MSFLHVLDIVCRGTFRSIRRRSLRLRRHLCLIGDRESMSLRVVVRVPSTGSPSATVDVSTSSADEEISDDPHVSPPPTKPTKRKKRKSSYLVRKEAMHQLREEEQVLETQIQALQARIVAKQASTLQYALEENRTLQSNVSMNRLTMAHVHSITSNLGIEVFPLSDYIHLPRDPLERRSILYNLKAPKIHAAVQFMLARVANLDLRRRSRQIETFETANGDYITIDCGVSKFTKQGLTVKHVFDEMINFAHTHEMSLADKLGVIAIRESEVTLDEIDVTQVRSLTSHGPRHLIEKNLAVFADYIPSSELLEQPHGLIVFDYIDHDEVYPYQPLTRIRKDVSAVSMVMECPQPRTVDDVPEIAIFRWSCSCIRNSPLATEDELADMGREGAFFDLMVQVVRERLAWTIP